VKPIFLLLLSIACLHAETKIDELFVKAISDGNLNTIETLLASGFNPDEPVHGYIPLYFAVERNRIDVIQLLLADHADPNAPVSGQPAGRFNSTPLHLAVQLGNLQAASTLLAAGAHADAKDWRGRTALHYAVTNSHLEVIRLLIHKGADLDVRDAEGASPLDEAVWHGSLDAVAMLLAHGARLNEPDAATGATPINEAAFLGDKVLVRYLLQFHPDLGLVDNHGRDPLGNAIKMEKEECSLLLLEAEPTERQTPDFLEKTLETAVPKDESLLVADLLQRGADVNRLLASGATPLDLAASTGAAKVMRPLLENGADPNAASRDGASPLEDASLRGFDSIAGMLLEHGADVNRINDGSQTTALYAAASFGKANVVKVLLSHAANPNLCGGNRKTPYQTASGNGFGEVATIIKNHGGTITCSGR